MEIQIWAKYIKLKSQSHILSLTIIVIPRKTYCPSSKIFAGKIIRILKKENPFEIYAGNWIVVVVVVVVVVIVVVVLYGFINNKNNKSLNRQYNYLSKNNMKMNSLSSIQSKF